MSTILEMQIDELQEENDALKALNQKLQLEKNALKEQLALYGVVSSACKKTGIIKVLNNRRKQAFDNQFHKYENNEMKQAIDIVNRLFPDD